MVYKLLKYRVREDFEKKRYRNCDMYLKELYETVSLDNKIKELEKKEIMWYYYFYKSNLLKKNDNATDALKICLKSFKFLDNKDEYNTDYKITLYLLAKIYENLKEIHTATKLYNFLLNMTKNEKHKQIILCSIKNIKNNNKEDLEFCQYF